MNNSATEQVGHQVQPDSILKRNSRLIPFDSASARAATLKGHAQRREREAQAKAEHDRLLALVKEQEQLKLEESAKSELERMTPDDRYRLERLSKVRKQIRFVDSLLESSIDADQISKLATASAKLAEQERLLAGRPTPGSNKPKSSKSKVSSDFEPE